MKKFMLLAAFALISCGPRETAPTEISISARPAVAIDGYGPIKIGMSRKEAERALGATLQVSPAAPGSDCQTARSPQGAELSFMLTGGKIARIDVGGGEIATPAGAHIGSSEADIARLYEGRLAVAPHKYEAGGHTLTVTDPDSPSFRYVFETDGRAVTRYRAGRLPEVEFVEGCG